MRTRALLLFGLIAAVTAGALVATVQLPEIPLLRYAVLAALLIGALVVVVAWYDPDALGSSGPRRDRQTGQSGQTPTEACIVRAGPSPTR
jgi:hypothetical protein